MLYSALYAFIADLPASFGGLPGGAERLIVDAACGLKGLGHEVAIYTSHWDPERCFKETRDGASRCPMFLKACKLNMNTSVSYLH